ncbi:MAG: hypothetical protein AAF607_03195 [Pseudomonadota bacterium]
MRIALTTSAIAAICAATLFATMSPAAKAAVLTLEVGGVFGETFFENADETVEIEFTGLSFIFRGRFSNAIDLDGEEDSGEFSFLSAAFDVDGVGLIPIEPDQLNILFAPNSGRTDVELLAPATGETLLVGAYQNAPIGFDGDMPTPGLFTVLDEDSTGIVDVATLDGGLIFSDGVEAGSLTDAALSPVPISGAAWMMLSGLGAAGLLRWRRGASERGSRKAEFI